jgi:hypothetical protein
MNSATITGELAKDERLDRLYRLLPAVYRMRDAEQGYPLQALLRVIAEQVNLVEDDITRLYDNWFIETCEDWVVPYLGDLIGWTPVREAGEAGTVLTEQGRARNKMLTPRRELANTIRYRRRKGTLALLEQLSADVAGWPARAVEFYMLLARTQAPNHLRLERGRVADLRDGAALELIDSPLDRVAHTVDVRRIISPRTPGRYNIPSVGLFVWRLRSYAVTETPAYGVEESGPNHFTFSVLGNDAPLFIRPERETDPTHIAEELNLPVPIRRRALETDCQVRGVRWTCASPDLYGVGKSLMIWTGQEVKQTATQKSAAKNEPPEIKLQPVPRESIIVADLTDWQYRPRRGTVAVDPVLGRIAFAPDHWPKHGVWVSYHYGFSADIGGGEYQRPLLQPRTHRLYRVGKDGEFATIAAALTEWRADAPQHAVIEITDSGVYAEPINIQLGENQSLQLRAANRRRPIIRLLDWQVARSDSLLVTGARGSRFTLDGLLITGRSVRLGGDLAAVAIRHSTLVPGWMIEHDCEPKRPTEPSLEIFAPRVRVAITHSITGSIQVLPELEYDRPAPSAKAEAEIALAKCGGIGQGIRLDPIRIEISDSILDATAPDREAIGAPGCPVAHAVLTILRSTVIGKTQVHAIELGENSIFNGRITVARRQIGCLRFGYVTPGSRTPRRYHCQPDLVEQAVDEQHREKSAAEREALKIPERRRVRPRFESVRYGAPRYCRLALDTAEEITRGADDQAEMGVFHDLFQPQRAANLRARLDEFLPARLDAGIIFAD